MASFETDEFLTKLARYTHNIVELNAKLKNDEEVKEYISGNNIVTEKVERYRIIDERLSKNRNFIYYIKNIETGEVITNINSNNPTELIQKQPVYMYDNQWKLKRNYYMYDDEIKKMLNGTSLKVYAAVQYPLKEGDEFYDDYIEYTKAREIIKYSKAIIGVSVILFIISSIYLILTAGRKQKGGNINLSMVDKIPFDLQTIFVIFAALFSLRIAVGILRPSNIETWVFFIILSSIDALIGITYFLSMARLIKSKKIIDNSLIYNILKPIKKFIILSFNGKTFKITSIFLLLFYGLVNGILFYKTFYLRTASIFTIILIIAFNIAAVYYVSKSLISLTEIMNIIKEISLGNLECSIDKCEITPEFLSMVQDIKSIQNGFINAVQEAVKGERMKTELIANVSHDLKTPLTSIINYIDLLKKEDIKEEKAGEYIAVLEEKALRLKQLIEDLIEASKASSGNLAVNLEKVDLHELVLQSCGEFEEKIRKAALDIKINCDEKNIFINADGKHMWRIIENLLSNAVKYSLANTRIYIDLLKEQSYGIFIIKNISAFPLNIPAEQLTERFVRGDVSRSTEGSGLGLSIAQSLTTLQGGNFKIDIDGDLFKVIVKIPLF